MRWPTWFTQVMRQSALRRGQRFVPWADVLEDRTLPASWMPVGPAPMLNDLVQETGGAFGSNNQNFSGRVSALAVTSDRDGQGHPALYVGSASGGLWRSTDFLSTNPTYVSLTDSRSFPVAVETGLGSGTINVGSIVVDPFHPQTIYVGTGEASGGGSARDGSGILKTTDGGNSWTISYGPGVQTRDYNGPAFFHQSISKIIVDPTNDGGATAPGETLYAAVTPAYLQSQDPRGSKAPGCHRCERHLQEYNRRPVMDGRLRERDSRSSCHRLGIHRRRRAVEAFRSRRRR